MKKVWREIVLRKGGLLLGGIVIFTFGCFIALLGQAATNISAASRFAWNDIIGWMDFYGPNTVQVTSQNLQGYASSSAGDISLNCQTTSAGNICSQSSYAVTNDGLGDLSNYAWNDQYGWISFDCHNNNGCASSAYQVLVDPNTGMFSGYAWNDTVGWISFNCSNNNGCGSSNYKVQSSWVATSAVATLDSSPFDTGVLGGAQINSVLWHGTQPAQTQVAFQFAVSNSSSGPWTFMGPDGTSNTSYTTGPDVSKRVDYILYNGKRYFSYRVILTSNQSQTATPVVNQVIVNWSP